jgi:lysophospholipase L1-like esterase
MPQRTELKLSRRKQLAFTVVAVLGFFLIVEVGFRVGHSLVTGDRYSLYHGIRKPLNAASDRYDGYFKFPPSNVLQQGTGGPHPIPTRINSLGFRGEDFDPHKAPGTYRILVTGGSSTFGYHARDEYTYATILGRLLDEVEPRRYEVLNLGTPHYTSSNILALLRAEGVGYEPDLVTIYTGYNDTVQSKIHRRKRGLRELRALPQHFFVFFTAWNQFKKFTRGDLVPESVKEKFELDEEQIGKIASNLGETFRSNIEQIIELSQQHDFSVLLIRQPMTTRYQVRSHLEEPLPYRAEVDLVRQALQERGSLRRAEAAILMHAHFMELLEEIAARHDVPLIDGLAHTDAHPDHLVSYVHLSEEGNEALARAMRDAIVANLAGDEPVTASSP